MKYFALLGVVIFILFALVQVNDPDPYIWMPVYIFPAILSFMVFRGNFYSYLIGIAALLYLAFSIATFPESMTSWIGDELNNTSLSMKTPSMEESRESLGTFICFSFLAIYFLYYYMVVKKKSLTN